MADDTAKEIENAPENEVAVEQNEASLPSLNEEPKTEFPRDRDERIGRPR